jgi:hypothetical protein
MSIDPNFEETVAQNKKLVEPDVTAAIAFLREVHPSGRWLLSAGIEHPNGKKYFTTAFFSTAEKAKDWVSNKNENLNIYFNINPVKEGYTENKKASKADIAHVEWLHVDIDPPKDCEDLEAWRAATKKRIAALDLPSPTIMIDSGRGFWLFWKLDKPAGHEDGESRNLGIAAIVGDTADNCHNIDRVARLPWTINWKTNRRAAMLVGDHKRVYSIDRFPIGKEKAKANGHAKFDGELPKVDLEALKLPDELVATIKQPDVKLPTRRQIPEPVRGRVRCRLQSGPAEGPGSDHRRNPARAELRYQRKRAREETQRAAIRRAPGQ